MTQTADFDRRWTFIARSPDGTEIDRCEAAEDGEALAYFAKAPSTPSGSDFVVYRVAFNGSEVEVIIR